MEIRGPEETPADPAPPSKRPALWAWPLILISAAAIVFAPQLLPGAAEITEVEDDAASLVVLRIQTRMIVAAAALDPIQAARELKGLESTATNDVAVAVVAALHVFIAPTTGGLEKADALLETRLESEVADEAFLERVRRALAKGVSDGERQELRAKLGGFADLFPAPGVPLSWPKGEEIRSRSLVTLILTAVASLGSLFFGLSGLILLIVGLRKKADGTLVTAEIAHPVAGPVLLEGFALFLFLLFLAQAAGWLLGGAAQIGLMIAGVAAVVIWPRWRTGLPWPELLRAFGLHRGKGFFREILAGAAGYLVIVPMAGAGLILTVILSTIGEAIQGAPIPAPSHPIVGMMEGGWIAVLFVFFLASVLAPLVEEISFRGAFFGALRSRWSFLASGLVTGLIFAAIHPQGFFAIPPLMAVGFGLALIREWRGSLIASMTAHAINNGILLAVALSLLS